MPQNPTQNPTTELTLVEALNRVTTADPGPAAPPEPETASAKAAFRRCCAAWQRAFKAYMDEEEGNPLNRTDIYLASQTAAPAYCSALPMLAGEDGIRDFLACTAHGIAIDAISLDKGAHLLYAAQIAASLSNPAARTPRQPLVRKTTSH
jgi:hypothetical protein